MGATVLVVDTNQFRDSPMLRSAEWVELIEKAADWDLRFAVPEVCLLEAISVVGRKWRAQRDKVAGLAVGEFGLSESQREWTESINRKIDGYEDDLRARLAEIGAEIVQIPDSVSLLDVARRAINRRKPYPEGDGTKDGFRDTLIWHTVEGIAAQDDDCEVWLISANHNDFGHQATADNDEMCPYPLHPHLVEDLQMGDLTGRVSYVRTVGRLAQHLASTYDAVSESERELLTTGLDVADFHRVLRDELNQLQLEPATAALPVRTLNATIQSIGDEPAHPHLVDVAMRGAGAWTAQFSQRISATIDLTDIGGDTSTSSKPLNVAGRLVVSADGSVKQIIVAAVEALPDDPGRRAWSRTMRPTLDPETVRRITEGMRPTFDPETLRKITEGMRPTFDPETLRKITEGMRPTFD
ncbi:PIN domain-containing protein, partial [Mycolicibacterium fortuitum]|uniref:PIN domain-containing protein n=1 Tax=Mycolicibacterium fortuitum TaxID=1766 RepID=UPI0014901714|nr:DUF4935 domain-containing protein [Mycolicibacterium fortuitum]